MVLRPLLLVLSAAGLLACRTTESHRPLGAETPIVQRALPARAWDVEVDGEVSGRVVLFSSDAFPESTVWVVRNLWQQDLGWIDRLGRAYRLLPHHREPAWVGTGTVAQGVERILRAGAPCTLVETPIGEAAAGPQE